MISFTTPKPISSTSFRHHQPSLNTYQYRRTTTIPIFASSKNSSSSSPRSSGLIFPSSVSNTPNSDSQPPPPPSLILPSSSNRYNSSDSSSDPPPQIIIPTASPTLTPQNFYQPYRPPPAELPEQYRNLDTSGRIEALANRFGRWFEYAPLISALFNEGFTPPAIEELTGLTGSEQNRLLVASQVRSSLTEDLDPETLSYFDSGGAELLYEIRLLTSTERAASAAYIVKNRLDGRVTRDLARSIKDFHLRRGDIGWEYFEYSLPGDCLAYMYFRQAREHRLGSEKWKSALEAAVRVVESEKGKRRVIDELEGRGSSTVAEGGVGENVEAVKVPVVRMKVGEVAAASTVVVLPVWEGKMDVNGIEKVPMEYGSRSGGFGIVRAEKEWGKWVVLPGWDPILGIGERGGVAVEFKTAGEVLPWRVKDVKIEHEEVLVVVERKRREVEVDDGFYLVEKEGRKMKVERGKALKEMGVGMSVGRVVLVVRPPMDEMEDELSDDDWD